MPTYGQRPDDVVQDTKGNALQGVTISFYDSESAAEAGGTSLGTVTTDNRGRWRFTPATDGELWARLPDATVWQVSPGRVGTKAEIDAEVAARQAADDQITKNARPSVVLKGAGIDTTGATDSTAGLKALFDAGLAAGSRHFVGVPGAVYKIAVADATTLFAITADRVTVDLSSCTLDNSSVSYTADTFTNIFLIDGAKDTTITVGRYVGYTLPTPASHLGYRGATLVRAINGADGVRVDARADNLRYGVQSGEYGDATKGGCKNFDVKIRGSMIGYSVAAYRADNITHDIDVDGVHRAAYIAGCNGVRGIARWRNQYVAAVAYLITDALTGGTDAAAQADPVGAATTSRGSSNIDVTVIDTGSTQFLNNSTCAGINLSRVDPCKFENIRVRVSVTGTDTVSTRVGGFNLTSVGVPATWSRYAYNWDQGVVLDNITVSGVVDHSAQTLPSNSTGELYIYTKDDAGEGAGKYATVRQLSIDGLTVLKSSAATPRDLYVIAREPAVPIILRGVHAPGLGLALQASATTPTRLENCTLAKVTTAGVVASLLALGDGNKVDTLAGSSPNRTLSQGIGGAGAVVMQKETTLSLSGASVTWSAAIPGGSILLGVQGRVQTTITGASGAQVGVSGDLTRFRNGDFTAVGATFGPAQQAATETSPKFYSVNTDIIVTARTANFTGGSLRLVLSYITFPALTA